MCFLPRNGDCLSHAWVTKQYSLDLSQLDPIATDLDLSITAPEELEVAVRPVAREVTGPVEAITRPIREGVGNELGRRQYGIVGVAIGQTLPADVEITCDLVRTRL